MYETVLKETPAGLGAPVKVIESPMPATLANVVVVASTALLATDVGAAVAVDEGFEVGLEVAVATASGVLFKLPLLQLTIATAARKTAANAPRRTVR